VASVELTLEQLREAIIQLPAAQRQKLLREVERLPEGDDARRLAQQCQGTFRMPAKERKRMSELLAKGNEGVLTAAESRELDALIDQFEQRTLDMARTVAGSKSSA
jgi:hypothetical protein